MRWGQVRRCAALPPHRSGGHGVGSDVTGRRSLRTTTPFFLQHFPPQLRRELGAQHSVYHLSAALLPQDPPNSLSKRKRDRLPLVIIKTSRGGHPAGQLQIFPDSERGDLTPLSGSGILIPNSHSF